MTKPGPSRPSQNNEKAHENVDKITQNEGKGYFDIFLSHSQTHL